LLVTDSGIIGESLEVVSRTSFDRTKDFGTVNLEDEIFFSVNVEPSLYKETTFRKYK
jgi:hypothetical protein